MMSIFSMLSTNGSRLQASMCSRAASLKIAPTNISRLVTSRAANQPHTTRSRFICGRSASTLFSLRLKSASSRKESRRAMMKRATSSRARISASLSRSLKSMSAARPISPSSTSFKRGTWGFSAPSTSLIGIRASNFRPMRPGGSGRRLRAPWPTSRARSASPSTWSRRSPNTSRCRVASRKPWGATPSPRRSPSRWASSPRRSIR